MSSSSSKATTAKKKPNYVSDSERSKRQNANLIERRRMQNINSGFFSLKKLLPPSDRKQTKAAILQQASQYILRLQRAVIQFKTENDTLRSTLDLKNQTINNTYSSKHHQLPNKHYESKTSQPKLMENEYQCNAESTTKQLASTSLEGQKSSNKRSVLPKPLHKQCDFESGWRPFEHVKKFEPIRLQTNALPNCIEVYPHAHAFGSSPLTPPISPAMNESRVSNKRSSSKEVVSAKVSPTLTVPTNNELLSPTGIRPVKPPKKNIFNSPTQTNVKPVRPLEKRARSSHKTDSGDLRRRQAKRMKEQPAELGDLQCILEAINIIENKENN